MPLQHSNARALAWAFLFVWSITACGGRTSQTRLVNDTHVTLHLHGALRDQGDEIWRWLSGVRAHLQTAPLPRLAQVQIFVHPTHADLERGVGRSQPAWVRAVARPGQLHLRAPSTWPEDPANEVVIGVMAHEWVHICLFAQMGLSGPDAVNPLPLPVSEGLASLWGGQGPQRPDLNALRAFVRSHPELDPFDPGGVDVEVFYTASHHWVAALIRQRGSGWVGKMTEAIKRGRAGETAFRESVGEPPSESQRRFLQSLTQSK